MVKMLRLLILFLPLLLLQQAEAQRTLVSLRKKLKVLSKSEERRRLTSDGDDMSGRWWHYQLDNGFKLFSWFDGDSSWEINDFLTMGTTILLVVITSSMVLLSRGEGE